MDVETRALGDITPYARNPRKISDTAVAKVAASIQEFGWRQPIVVDDAGVIIVGHTRLQAAQRLGLTEAPVHVAEGLTPEQAKAYRLADNRTGEEAIWDQELLGLEFSELHGIDLEMTGFEGFEIQSAIAISEKGEGLTDEDAAPEIQEEVVSCPGDLWCLGKHRVLCGDSTSAEDVVKLLNGVEPHLMVTDPPYGVEYDADWRNRADRANGKPYGARAVGTVANDGRADWSEVWALFPGDVLYIWHAGNKADIVAASIKGNGFDIRAQIIWAKHRQVIGRGHYHPHHEPCWYGVRKSKTGHWCGGRKQTTLWSIEHLKSDTGHSTQKPVECMRRPMENNSSPGQAVYDPFLGSGTSIIAAETSGRHCYGLEIEPAYVDVIVRRWEAFTGQDAILEGDGATFKEIMARREAA